MKRTIKRLAALLCAVMLLLGLSGCKAAPAGDPPTVTDPVAPVTDPVTPAAEPVTPEKLQELFATGGWYAQALTSTYEDPRDVDLVQMFYNGGGRQVTQEEYDYVQRQLDGPDTDVMAVSPAEMDAALTEAGGDQQKRTGWVHFLGGNRKLLSLPRRHQYHDGDVYRCAESGRGLLYPDL